MNKCFKNAISNYYAGKPISDAELAIAINCLESTIEVLSATGERFFLATKELRAIRSVLEDFQRFRRSDGSKT